MSTQVRFYHLTMRSVDETLPLLLEKTLERSKRAVVRFETQERLAAINQNLWTYNERRFLPHGSAKEGFEPDQPIWLTCEDDSPNGASYEFLLENRAALEPQRLEMVAILFDARDEQAVQAARGQWKTLKALPELALSYWQQTLSGGWEQKA